MRHGRATRPQNTHDPFTIDRRLSFCTLKGSSPQGSSSSNPTRLVRVGNRSTSSTTPWLSLPSEEMTAYSWIQEPLMLLYTFKCSLNYGSSFTPITGLTLKTKGFIVEDINKWECCVFLWMTGDTWNIEHEGNACCHLKIRIFSPFSVFS